MNTTTAMQAVKSILAAAAPRGTRPHDLAYLLGDDEARSYLSIEVERGWAVNCTLNVSVHYEGIKDVREPGAGHAAPTYKIPTYKLDVTVNWSSTGRTTVQALAAVALYQEMVQLAAEIEARLGGEELHNEGDLEAAKERDEKAKLEAEVAALYAEPTLYAEPAAVHTPRKRLSKGTGPRGGRAAR